MQRWRPPKPFLGRLCKYVLFSFGRVRSRLLSGSCLDFRCDIWLALLIWLLWWKCCFAWVISALQRCKGGWIDLHLESSLDLISILHGLDMNLQVHFEVSSLLLGFIFPCNLMEVTICYWCNTPQCLFCRKLS